MSMQIYPAKIVMCTGLPP